MSLHVDAGWPERARRLLAPGRVYGDLIGRIAVSVAIQTMILGLLFAGLVAVPLVLGFFGSLGLGIASPDAS